MGERKRWRRAEADADTRRLREALQARVQRSPWTQRELERELVLGHGTVRNILSGRTELRIRHLALFGRALGFTVEELLTEAYGLVPPEVPEDVKRRTLVAEVVRAELAAFWDRHGLRLEGTDLFAWVEEVEP